MSSCEKGCFVNYVSDYSVLYILSHVLSAVSQYTFPVLFCSAGTDQAETKQKKKSIFRGDQCKSVILKALRTYTVSNALCFCCP